MQRNIKSLVLNSRLEKIMDLYDEFHNDLPLFNDETISDYDLLLLVNAYASRHNLTMHETIVTIKILAEMIEKETE